MGYRLASIMPIRGWATSGQCFHRVMRSMPTMLKLTAILEKVEDLSDRHAASQHLCVLD